MSDNLKASPQAWIDLVKSVEQLDNALSETPTSLQTSIHVCTARTVLAIANVLWEIARKEAQDEYK